MQAQQGPYYGYGQYGYGAPQMSYARASAPGSDSPEAPAAAEPQSAQGAETARPVIDPNKKYYLWTNRGFMHVIPNLDNPTTAKLQYYVWTPRGFAPTTFEKRVRPAQPSQGATTVRPRSIKGTRGTPPPPPAHG